MNYGGLYATFLHAYYRPWDDMLAGRALVLIEHLSEVVSQGFHPMREI